MKRITPFHPDCVNIRPDNGAIQIAAIADGETLVRYWNPDLLHGTYSAALKRVSKMFPCVHRIVPTDPYDTRKQVDKPCWSIAPKKLDWARYARDYVITPPESL